MYTKECFTDIISNFLGVEVFFFHLHLFVFNEPELQYPLTIRKIIDLFGASVLGYASTNLF